MENFESIFMKEYELKYGKKFSAESMMASGSSGSGAGFQKSVSGSRMSANVYGQDDDPFSLLGSSKNEGTYGSREDLFTPAADDNIFRAQPPKRSEGGGGGARYDNVFSAPPVYDDLAGGYGGTASKVPNFSSGSSRRNPNFVSSEPKFDDELLPGFGFMPKSQVKASYDRDPFEGLGSVSGSSTTHTPTPFEDDSLLPGFDMPGPFSRGSRSFSRQESEAPPLVPLYDEAVSSSISEASSPFVDDGLLSGFGSGGSFREANFASGADSLRGFGDQPVSSSKPSPSPPLDDPFSIFNESQAPPSGRSSGKPSASPPLDDPFSIFNESRAPPRKSFSLSRIPSGSPPTEDPFDIFNETKVSASRSSSGRRPSGVSPSPPLDDPFNMFTRPQVPSGGISSSQPIGSPPVDDLFSMFSESQSLPRRSSSRFRGNGLEVDPGYQSFDSFAQSPPKSTVFNDSPEDSPLRTFGADISRSLPDDPFFSSPTESFKKADEEDLTWDLPTSDEPPLPQVKLDGVKLMTRPSFAPPTRRPPPLPGSGGSSFKEREIGSGGSSFKEREIGSGGSSFKEMEFGSGGSSFKEREEFVTSADRGKGVATPPPSYEQVVETQPIPEEKEREERLQFRKSRRREREEARAIWEAEEKAAAILAAEKAMAERILAEARERAARAAAEKAAAARELERERETERERERAEKAAAARELEREREREREKEKERAESAAAAAARERETERAEKAAAARKLEREREMELEKERERERERVQSLDTFFDLSSTPASSEPIRSVPIRSGNDLESFFANPSAPAPAPAPALAKSAPASSGPIGNENDLESFFASSTPASSKPIRKDNDLDPFFGQSSKPHSRVPIKIQKSTSRSTTPTFSSAPGGTSKGANIDDWGSIFGAATSSGGSGRGGEPAKSSSGGRNDKHEERARGALDELHRRNLEAQREQAEKERAGDVLDAQIKKWAAGKEGNLRALLSSLQFVLWPESGWTPIPLTDLITATQVKHTYKKAWFYVHPDKVQQKGCTIQQKYVAEKVFHLLKEASNKFNSEELF